MEPSGFMRTRSAWRFGPAPGVRAETNVKCRVLTGPLADDMKDVRGWLLEADALSVRRVRATVWAALCRSGRAAMCCTPASCS